MSGLEWSLVIEDDLRPAKGVGGSRSNRRGRWLA